MPDNTFTFEIREHLGVIARYESGWRKELNLVSWNGGAPKYDVRDWDPHHEDEPGTDFARRRDEKTGRSVYQQQQSKSREGGRADRGGA